MTEHETVESEFRLGTAALLEQTVIGRLSESGLGLPEGALVLGGGGGVAAVQLHRPVQDLDMRLTFDGNAAGRSNEVLNFLAHEVLTEGTVVPGRRDTATTVTGKFGGLDVSITLAPVHPQEHQMHVVVNGETHTGETVPLKVVASEDLLGDKIAALAMRKQDAKVDVAMLREKRLRDATDVLTLYSKLEPGALDRLRNDRESLRPAIGKLADVVAEVSKHSGDRLTPEQRQTLDEISRGLGSAPTARPAKAPKSKPTPEELAALKAQKEENKRLKAAAAAAAQAAPAPPPVPHQDESSAAGATRGPGSEHTPAPAAAPAGLPYRPRVARHPPGTAAARAGDHRRRLLARAPGHGRRHGGGVRPRVAGVGARGHGGRAPRAPAAQHAAGLAADHRGRQPAPPAQRRRGLPRRGAAVQRPADDPLRQRAAVAHRAVGPHPQGRGRLRGALGGLGVDRDQDRRGAHEDVPARAEGCRRQGLPDGAGAVERHRAPPRQPAGPAAGRPPAGGVAPQSRRPGLGLHRDLPADLVRVVRGRPGGRSRRGPPARPPRAVRARRGAGPTDPAGGGHPP
ncbi:nucleotidyl transferase AbiEii/AbiGii toxin family protein [Kitasatospora paranensis]|uniref:nucleotidyl transferase AbiEii/AbiGii toxin family protein n=1 Tax=Kitasatospora paranensis TaxID=258053 RepID=UPI0031EC1284